MIDYPNLLLLCLQFKKHLQMFPVEEYEKLEKYIKQIETQVKQKQSKFIR